jgi:hypothetical protein
MATHANSTTAPAAGEYRHRRKAVENTLKSLIALLDELDGDTDLEPDSDREQDVGDQCEQDADTEEGDGDVDAEPSLGAPERHDGYGSPWGGITYAASQTRWAQGSRSDRELTEDTQEGDPLDEKGELNDSDREPDHEEGDGEFAGGDRRGADEKPLPPAAVEALTAVRGPSRLPRKPVERSRPGWCNVTIIGPTWSRGGASYD